MPVTPGHTPVVASALLMDIRGAGKMSKWKGIQIRLSTQPKDIPYAPDPESDVHQVIWLSREPDRAGEIPELNRHPELKRTVLSLNAPGCRFETFRCGSSDEQYDGQFHSNFNIGLIYRDRNAFADYGAQFMVAGEILGFATDSDIFSEGSNPFLIEIERVHLKTEGIQGWTVDLWHRSSGNEAQEARTRANQALGFVGSVLSAKSS